MKDNDGVRWLVAFVAVLLVIALVAYARGTKHHHGDEVGSHGMAATATAPARVA
jgi:hypothetical protein